MPADLLRLLEDYRPHDSGEAESVRRIRELASSRPGCFEREHPGGHVTGSAWVLEEGGERTLLTLHRKIGKWFQPGGHCDGQKDVAAVALREASEESGISDLSPWLEGPFDVDVHRIGEFRGQPAHDHHDVVFAFIAQAGSLPAVSEESIALEWVGLDDPRVRANARLSRMAEKTRLLLLSGRSARWSKRISP